MNRTLCNAYCNVHSTSDVKLISQDGQQTDRHSLVALLIFRECNIDHSYKEVRHSAESWANRECSTTSFSRTSSSCCRWWLVRRRKRGRVCSSSCTLLCTVHSEPVHIGQCTSAPPLFTYCLFTFLSSSHLITWLCCLRWDSDPLSPSSLLLLLSGNANDGRTVAYLQQKCC